MRNEEESAMAAPKKRIRGFGRWVDITVMRIMRKTTEKKARTGVTKGGKNGNPP